MTSIPAGVSRDLSPTGTMRANMPGHRGTDCAGICRIAVAFYPAVSRAEVTLLRQRRIRPFGTSSTVRA